MPSKKKGGKNKSKSDLFNENLTKEKYLNRYFYKDFFMPLYKYK